jgi:hypothetical protein
MLWNAFNTELADNPFSLALLALRSTTSPTNHSSVSTFNTLLPHLFSEVSQRLLLLLKVLTLSNSQAQLLSAASPTDRRISSKRLNLLLAKDSAHCGHYFQK